MYFQEKVLKYKVWIFFGSLALILVALAPIRQLSFLGFSHCGRVWSEIQTQEDNIILFLNETGALSRFSIAQDSDLDKIVKDIPNNLDIIWRIGVNNPRCLSNSQQSYVAKYDEANFRQTIFTKSGWSYRGGVSFDEISIGDYTPLINR